MILCPGNTSLEQPHAKAHGEPPRVQQMTGEHTVVYPCDGIVFPLKGVKC